MSRRQAGHVLADSFRLARQIQQVLHFFDRKSELTAATQENQTPQVVGWIFTVAGCRAGRRLEQPGTLDAALLHALDLCAFVGVDR